jgi:hypothetical protein
MLVMSQTIETLKMLVISRTIKTVPITREVVTQQCKNALIFSIAMYMDPSLKIVRFFNVHNRDLKCS